MKAPLGHKKTTDRRDARHDLKGNPDMTKKDSVELEEAEMSKR